MSINQANNSSWVEKIIGEFCATPANTLGNATGEPAWGDPQVGYARGDDPLFDRPQGRYRRFLLDPAGSVPTCTPW